MSVITAIRPAKDKPRHHIFIDGVYASSVRSRVLPALKLHVGLQITAAEIRRRDDVVFKTQYGTEAWKRGEARVKVVRDYIARWGLGLMTEYHGHGADSLEWVEGHAATAGEPDLKVLDTDGSLFTYLEVSGTETLRGDANAFWVCPHKVEWAKKNPDAPYMIALHYAKPVQRMVFFTPDPNKDYAVKTKVIRGVEEPYICIGREDVIGARAFVDVLRARVEVHRERPMDAFDI